MSFPFIPASTPSLIAFLAIVLAILVALTTGLYVTYRKFEGEKAAKKTRVIMFWVVVWLIAFCAAVESGYARENPFPGIPMLLLLVLITSLAFAFSPIGRKLSYGIAIPYLVLFQVFRLPLELVLHEWVAQGVIPRTMTWTGENFDILAGGIALLAFPFAARFPIAARVANIVGLASLLNVLRVALLSSPIPMGWNVEPKLQVMLYAPYCLIGPVCVGGALIGHVLLLRALFMPAKSSEAAHATTRAAL